MKKKIKLIQSCNLEDSTLQTILMSFSDKNKYLMIIKKDLHPHMILVLLSSIKSSTYLANFFEKHKDILDGKNIKPYSIVHRLSDKQQLEFIKMLENGQISLTPKEKRCVLGSLSNTNKEIIKKHYKNSKLPEEYKIAFDMKVNKMVLYITIDFKSDLQKYKGWDDMIRVCATSLSDEERKKLFELCQICPNMQINDDDLESATVDIDKQHTKEIYKSIGVADKKGYFPIEILMSFSIIIEEKCPPEIRMGKN